MKKLFFVICSFIVFTCNSQNNKESLEKTIKVKHKAKTGSRIAKVERVTATVNSSGNGVTLTGGSAGAREHVTGAIIGAATSSLGGLQSRGQINNLDGSNNSASLNKPGTTTGTTTTGIDSGSPKAPGSAPDTIDLSALDPQFLALWAKSFSGGKSQEQGGTIVEGKTGSEYLVNEDSGTSGSFAPNLTPPSSNFLLLGIFHTHPYDSTAGGDTGVSLSGADAAHLINGGYKVSIVQSGSLQFMLMRTHNTSTSVNSRALSIALTPESISL